MLYYHYNQSPFSIRSKIVQTIEGEMTALLEISTFGGLAIKLAGEPLGKLASRKADALLVYLACTRQTQARDLLADLLWDDRPQDQAMAKK